MEPTLVAMDFDQALAHARRTVFGVDYVYVADADGGEMYLTRYGWNLRRQLDPRAWYHNQRYVEQGLRLPGSTGTVYRMPVLPLGNTATAGGAAVGAEAGEPRPAVAAAGGPPPGQDKAQYMVVKFSRFACDVPLHAATTYLRPLTEEELSGARFNSPFEEFGLLMDLRRGRFGPADLRLLTKRPLAIYCPARPYAPWETGRSQAQVQDAQRRMQSQQADPRAAVRIHADRDYILIFAWVRGCDAEQAADRNLLDDRDLLELTKRSEQEMQAKGFRVLDHKPKHLIVRTGRDGRLLHRHGKLVYALIDFELLLRTAEYYHWLHR